MRKINLAIVVATLVAEVIGFWAITSVVKTSASAPTTHVIQVKPIALPEVLVKG
jgi:hypothetical protein